MGKTRPAHKQRREPTPPSSDEEADDDFMYDEEGEHVHGSDCGSECDGGTVIPALDIAILAHLRQEEQKRLAAVDEFYVPRAMKILKDYTAEQSRFVRDEVQPHVMKVISALQPLVNPLYDKAEATAAAGGDVCELDEGNQEQVSEFTAQLLSYYGVIFDENLGKGPEFEKQAKLRLRLVSLAMAWRQQNARAGRKSAPPPASEQVPTPMQWFDVADPLHCVVRCAEDMFHLNRYTSAITVRYVTPEDCCCSAEELAKAKSLPVACIGLEYTFYFVDAANLLFAKMPFTNRQWRILFLFAGTRVERLAVLKPGRLVDIRAEPLQWRSEEIKNRVLIPHNDEKLFSRGILGTFGAGFLPVYDTKVRKNAQNAEVVGPSMELWTEVSRIGQVCDRVLGSLAGVGSQSITQVDVEVFQRVLEQFDKASNNNKSKLSIPIFADEQKPKTPTVTTESDKKGKKRARVQEEEEQDNDAGPPPTRLRDCLASLRTLLQQVTTTSTSAVSLPELDIARRVILLHEAFGSFALRIMWPIAVGPVELALGSTNNANQMMEEEDEEDEEEDYEEFDEDDEEEEDEEEPEKVKTRPAPVVVAKKSAAAPSGSSMKGKAPPPKPGQQDCKQQ